MRSHVSVLVQTFFKTYICFHLFVVGFVSFQNSMSFFFAFEVLVYFTHINIYTYIVYLLIMFCLCMCVRVGLTALRIVLLLAMQNG